MGAISYLSYGGEPERGRLYTDFGVCERFESVTVVGMKNKETVSCTINRGVWGTPTEFEGEEGLGQAFVATFPSCFWCGPSTCEGVERVTHWSGLMEMKFVCYEFFDPGVGKVSVCYKFISANGNICTPEDGRATLTISGEGSDEKIEESFNIKVGCCEDTVSVSVTSYEEGDLLDAKKWRYPNPSRYPESEPPCRLRLQTCSGITIPAHGDTTVVMKKRKESLSVSASKGGTAVIVDGGSEYTNVYRDWGTKLRIVATPDECYRFVRWEWLRTDVEDPHGIDGSVERTKDLEALPAEDCEFDDEYRRLYVKEWSSRYRAIFEPITYIVRVKVMAGRGEFSVEGTSIGDGDYIEVGCGDGVSIKAVPLGCNKFSHWDDGGEDATISLDDIHADTTVRAYFSKCETVGDQLVYDASGLLLYKRCGNGIGRLMYGHPEPDCACDNKS